MAKLKNYVFALLGAAALMVAVTSEASALCKGQIRCLPHGGGWLGGLRLHK